MAFVGVGGCWVEMESEWCLIIQQQQQKMYILIFQSKGH